jgi:hypothetical protein
VLSGRVIARPVHAHDGLAHSHATVGGTHRRVILGAQRFPFGVHGRPAVIGGCASEHLIE